MRQRVPWNRWTGWVLKKEWMAVIRKFPDRFIIGSNQFYMSSKARKPELASKLGSENAEELFYFQ